MLVRFLFLVSVLSFSLSSCSFNNEPLKGNGKVVREQRLFSNFSGVQVLDELEVFVRMGEENEVVVVADENLQSSIMISQRGNLLILQTKTKLEQVRSKKIYVTMKNVEEVIVQNSAQVFSQETLTGKKKCVVNLSSGGLASLDFNLTELEVTVANGSNLHLFGQVKRLNCALSRGSFVDAERLKVRDVWTNAQEGSTCLLSSCSTLNGKSVTGSRVAYKGSPIRLKIKEKQDGVIESE